MRVLLLFDDNGRLVSSAGDSDAGALPRAVCERELGPRALGVLRGAAHAELWLHADTVYRCRWSLLRPIAPGAFSVLAELCPAEDGDEGQRVLARRLRFEALITQLSTHFMNLGPNEVDAGIDYALAEVGTFCEVDRAYLFLLASDRQTGSNTHEWCRAGIESQIHELQNLEVGAFPWWVERILANHVIHVPTLSVLGPEAAEERRFLEQHAIRSVVAVPANYRGTVLGFLAFDSVHVEKEWTDEDVSLLRLVGEMLVSAIERKRAEERRHALENQLIRARSLENVAKLAGGVAHDFNNLLAIVLNCAAVLRRDLDDPGLRELADHVWEVAHLGAKLTRQLLIVGRRGVVQPKLLDVNAVVMDIGNLLRSALGENIELRFELTPDLRTVRMGLPELEQVILNLAMNARDACPHGGEVVIRTFNEEAPAGVEGSAEPGSAVVLSVRDNGVGMTEEVAARALEPFFSTKGTAGTGLGLSTVDAIARQAGGSVSLESRPELGTRIDVRFPAVLEVEPESEPPAASAPSPAPQNQLIVVVDDSDRLRRLVRMHLESAGYRVLDAGTPTAALELCRKETADLLLTDVILPEMSGKELASALRTRGAVRRVAYMSGYDDQVIASQGIVPEGTWLLPKPFAETELIAFVSKVFRDAGQ